MKCCAFGFSTCSFSYLYILFTIVFYFLKYCILSFSELSSKNRINIFGIEPVLTNHKLMMLLIEYLGYIIFGGLFFYFFRIRKIIKKNKKEKIEENNHPKNMQLIFKKQRLSKKAIKILLIACFLFAIQLIIRGIMNFLSLGMLDLWIFNIIFISFFMKIILKVEFYKHQLYSLGINFFINFVLLIASSSLKEKGKSQYEKIADNFGNYFYIVLFYLVFLALSAMICSSQVMQKHLMDVENVSAFTILFIIGLLSSFFTLIALIMTTSIKCNEVLTNKQFCWLSGEDNIYYFDSFKIYKNNMSKQYQVNKSAFFIEIFLVYPLYSLACYLKYYSETMIVYHLNPNYVLISDNVYFSVKTIIALMNDKAGKGSILMLIGDIISLIAYCFYLEIIILKCCNMHFNTRISINERSISEGLDIGLDKDDEDDEDDIKFEDNNKEKEMVEIKKEEEN